MAFKIPKATSADDIAVWLTGAKQQLDDYFVQLPASHYDEFFSYLPAAEQAVEAQAMRAAEKTNYLQDIERQAKRFGYQPTVRKNEQALSGGDIDTDFVPDDAPVQGRSAKAGGGVLKGGESRKEILAKMKAAGKAWDSVNKQWADKNTLMWDDSIRKFIPRNSQPQSTPQEVPGTVTTIPTNNGAIAPVDVSVLSTQPQYEGKSSVETAPPSGVNLAADGYQSGTSSGIPMTGSNVPPSKPPGGGNYDFEGGEFNSPDAQPQTGTYWENLWDGATKGFKYAVDAGKYEGRTASAAWNRAPESQYAYLQDEGKFGFGVGRVAGDVIGNGSRQVLWNIHPADLLGTYGPKILGEDASRMAKVVVPFAAVTGLELGSQVYNPFNLGEGGRVAGYQAINPDEDDPRISTTPVSELLIDRGFLGKRGRLLPWEQFRQERTDIPYEQYEKYQNYLRNKDENALRDMTGGLLKGTLDGINGPELSVMGYSVTPTGALAAGAALLAGRELVRTGRIARFRK